MILTRSLLCLSLLGVVPAAARAQATDAPTTASDPSAARCAVWARETSFAGSVAAHDPAAFAEHLHPDAVFINGDGSASRGAEAIARDWAGLIAGDGVRLHWYPDAVDVGADGKLALSRGPYWLENPSASSDDKRYRRGRFISTWRLGDDGRWQVVFDGGAGDAPVAATAEDIAVLRAASRACPAR